jgi:hypothetical protein
MEATAAGLESCKSMTLNAQGMLDELQTLKVAVPASTLPRLRELAEALDQAITTDRHSPAGIAIALTHQAISYICEGIESEQNGPEIKRRFAIAIRRTEGWAVASAQARSDDPRFARSPD